MNALINITTNEQGSQVVDARGLHKALEVGREFSKWINKHMIKSPYFAENEDYVRIANNGESKMNASKDYAMTIDTAMSLCISANSKNKDVVFEYLKKQSKSIVKIKFNKVERKEAVFFDGLINIIKHDVGFDLMTIKSQYKVLDYRIDLVDVCEESGHIQLFEYDEEYHRRPKQKERDEKRMSKISSELKRRGFKTIQLFRIREGQESEFYYWYTVGYLNCDETAVKHLHNFMKKL